MIANEVARLPVAADRDAKAIATSASETSEVSETSGAPEETSLSPVWDKDNRLVDVDLSTHFKEESEKVLGLRDVEGKPTRELDQLEVGEVAGIDLQRLRRFDEEGLKPEETQRLESQTADPMTNPQPAYDPNTRPTPIASLYRVGNQEVKSDLTDEEKSAADEKDKADASQVASDLEKDTEARRVAFEKSQQELSLIQNEAGLPETDSKPSDAAKTPNTGIPEAAKPKPKPPQP